MSSAHQGHESDDLDFEILDDYQENEQMDYDDTNTNKQTNDQPAVSSFTLCDLECCESHRKAPFQTLTSRDINSSKRKQGKQLCVFQKTWFNEHKWLTYCLKHNIVYCFYCRMIHLMKGFTFSKRSDPSFISKGFCNWKKGKEKFREHEISQTHHEAILKYESLKQPNVMVVANSSLKKEQENRRKMLLVQLQSLRFLMCQGLVVRGHYNEGNLFQLMKIRAHDISQLNVWLSDGKYQSPEIVNKQIELKCTRMSCDLYSLILENVFMD